MDRSDNNSVGIKVIPRNELSNGESKMTWEQLVNGLSDLQDELNARGLTEPAQLLHRALNKLTTCTLPASIIKKMEGRKKDESA